MSEEINFITDNLSPEQQQKLRSYEEEVCPGYTDLLDEFEKTRSIRTAVDIADLDLAFRKKILEIKNEG